MNSPKNKFRVNIQFEKPLKGIGNSTCFTADNVEQLDAYIKALNYKGTATFYENKEKYPIFKWIEIDKKIY